MALHHPVRDIDIMHMLLHNMVAGKPCEEIPVPDLPLDGGIRRDRTGAAAHAAAVPVDLPAHDIADRAIVNSLDRLKIRKLMAALSPGHHTEILGLGDFRRCQYFS